MHNRKTSSKTASPVLPMNINDVTNNNNGVSGSGHRKSRSSGMQNVYKILVIVFTIAIFFSFSGQSNSEMEDDDEVTSHVGRKEVAVFKDAAKRKLSEFASLKYPLETSAIVGLYFAAAWCPMSTPVTESLDKLFRDSLVKPMPEEDVVENMLIDMQPKSGFSIVYVSSDKDDKQFESYLKPNWFSVPFEHTEERRNLKIHFKTCAKKELKELGIERKHEIPTLIIVSGETHEVLTYDGVQDIKESGAKAVDHWLELNRLNIALREKYSEHR